MRQHKCVILHSQIIVMDKKINKMSFTFGAEHVKL